TVWKMDFLVDGEPMPLANGRSRRRPFANAVQRQHRGSIERRRIEGRSRMTQMMLGENQFVFPIEIRLLPPEFANEQRLLKQLFAQPKRQRHAKRCKAARSKTRIGFE